MRPAIRGIKLTGMSDPRAAVRTFIQEFWEPDRAFSDDDDLFAALGIEGDDASGFMEVFVDRFGVDASEYRWYFHHADEGWNFGALFYRPIYRRFGRIPITVTILTEAVRTSRWPVVYPAPVIPRWRWDILINQITTVLALLGLVVWGWMSFIG